MTNAFKKDYVNIENSLRRLSYSAFLKLRKDMVEYHLEFSLMLDGRFYGAEWQEEEEEDDRWLSQYMGWIVFEKYRWLNKT